MNLEILGLILIVIIYNLIMSAFRKNNVSTFYCGLIGFSGTDNYNLDKIKFLMIWNSIERGKDSTGIFTPESGIHKKAEIAGKFFASGEDRNVKRSKLFIGHVRAKTVGINNLNNSHPFKKENITLAHNGTLLSYSKLASDYNMKFNDYDVDSQIITEAVFQDTFNQKDEEFKNIKLLEKYEGAAALLFHNEFTPDILYVYRDSERPLFKGYDDNGNMYISSLKDTLEALDLYVIDSFEQNTLYTIKNGEILNEEKYITKRVVEEKLKEEEKLRKDKEPKKPVKKDDLKISLNTSQRGVKSISNQVHNLSGSWLMIKYSHKISDKAILNNMDHYIGTPNDWIYIDEEKRCGNLEYISVTIDSTDNEFKFIYNCELDYDNFLPKPGDYVIAMTKIVSKRQSLKLWDEGEPIKILTVDYENKTAQGDYKEQVSYNLPFEFFRVMTSDERTQHEEEIFFDQDSDTNNPFMETNDLDIKKLLQESNTDNDDNSDDENDSDFDVDYEVHCALLSEINDQIEFIEERYPANLDITTQINEIKSILSKGLTKDYLELTKKHKNNTKC